MSRDGIERLGKLSKREITRAVRGSLNLTMDEAYSGLERERKEKASSRSSIMHRSKVLEELFKKMNGFDGSIKSVSEIEHCRDIAKACEDIIKYSSLANLSKEEVEF